LKVRLPGGGDYAATLGQVRGGGLTTVCEEARCPNRAECWGQRTATFMLLGDSCTRGCRFCAVKTARRGAELDPREPRRVAAAVRELGLRYVVLTSVDRDDLPDGGAAHFAAAVRAIQESTRTRAETGAEGPPPRVEVLLPDFGGDQAALRAIVAARPDVIGHNLEVVRRLSPTIRDPRCDHDLSLEVLARYKELAPATPTKSSLMLGLGESDAEVIDCFAELRAAGVDVVTLGQYLRPSMRHVPVVEYVPLERFAALGRAARKAGFTFVASGPLVRSSYRAAELFLTGAVAERSAPGSQ
jgi:lipoic acid synthetase